MQKLLEEKEAAQEAMQQALEEKELLEEELLAVPEKEPEPEI